MTTPKHLRVLKTNFRGNPNVGLYLYATDTYCLAGNDVPDEELPKIADVLGVPVHRFSVAGTGLVGVFLAGTNDMLLVPSILFDNEIAILEKHKIPYTVMDTLHTALGNNIIVNNNGALVSTEYSDADRKEISEALGVPVKPLQFGEITVVGSSCAINARGGVIHRGVKDFEKEMVEDTLNLKLERGTINMGNPYVRGGLCANNHGLVVGDVSGGPEIVNAEEALRGEE